MNNLKQLRSVTPGLHVSVGTVTLALAIVFGLAVVASQAAQAQTFNVLHTFTGGSDGGNPSAGVTIKAGVLYGTTYEGGAGYGAVYQMKHVGSGWTLNPLHNFAGSDGAIPTAPVVFGPDGALYGTTEFGGANSKGNVFKLRPSPTACKTALCPWSETVIYSFEGGTDGSQPIGIVFGQAGNIYGTTSSGGTNANGTAYELTSSGGGWTESVQHSFGSYYPDGLVPYRSLMTFDNAGNLYGTTFLGGASNAGSVFQLTPSGSGWIETVIYNFQGNGDGRFPYSGLIIDQSGNLYGTTTDAGIHGGGTVFELSPSGGGWTYSVLYSLTGSLGESCGPAWALVMDADGNLYDMTQCDGANGLGNVFKLTNTGGSWTYTSLHDFSGSDGSFPLSGVTFDPSGNLYGTTYYGGANNYGVVWEITP
jgi:uncharacterized repeat protein (TIGR03803 family)